MGAPPAAAAKAHTARARREAQRSPRPCARPTGPLVGCPSSWPHRPARAPVPHLPTPFVRSRCWSRSSADRRRDRDRRVRRARRDARRCNLVGLHERGSAGLIAHGRCRPGGHVRLDPRIQCIGHRAAITSWWRRHGQLGSRSQRDALRPSHGPTHLLRPSTLVAADEHAHLPHPRFALTKCRQPATLSTRED